MPEILTASALMTGDETVTDGAVVIGDRTVDWAGPAGTLPAEYAALPSADYPDSTILPGLIDSHVHLGFDGGPDPAARMRAETDEQQLILMLNRARELLGVGVTTARDLGGRGYLNVAVRDAIAEGLARGPRMVVAAHPITVTGGHCWFMGGEADSEDDLRRMVRTHHKHGADLIKVMSTGGFMTTGSAPWYAQFTAEQLAVIVAEATTEAAAVLGVGAVTGRLAPGYDADLIVVDGDPLADIPALGRLRRVIARGRDYVPDSGRFDVSAPGTPFASPDHVASLRFLTEATRRRRA